MSDNDTRWAPGVVGQGTGPLWRDGPFLTLWGGQGLALLADAALRIVLLIRVYQVTRSGAAVSLVGLAEAAPLLLLGPIAGVLVDRWSRAATLAGAALARAFLLGALALAPGHVGVPALVLVALLANAASQFFGPAAAAALPVVVGLERIGQANSLIALVSGGVAVTVPGPAALLLAAAGPQRTFAVLAVLYSVAVPLLLAVPARRASVGAGEENGSQPPFHAAVRAGLAAVWESPPVRAIALVTCLTMLGIGALSVLDVVFVTRALHQRPEVASLLFTAMGAGEAAGSVLVTLAQRPLRRRYHRLLGLAVLANGLCNLAYAGAPTLAVAVVLMGGVGLSLPAITVASLTVIQRQTDDRLMGRVMGVIGTASSVALLTSTAGAGVLADFWGVRPVIAGAAALLLAAALVALVLLWTMPLPVPSPRDREHGAALADD